MIDRNTPSDPRLRERRGDLVGRNALFFTVLLVAAVGALIWALLGFLPGDDAPSLSPSGMPTGTTGSPSLGASSPSPSGSIGPSPTSVAPSPSGGATVGEPVELMIDGTSVGTVTVQAPDYRRKVRGEEAPGNRRWAVVEVTYEATADLEYDAARWTLLSLGAEYEWAGVDPRPPLGTGRLGPGESVTGFVTFQVPANRALLAIVLTPEAGDQLVFLLP